MGALYLLHLERSSEPIDCLDLPCPSIPHRRWLRLLDNQLNDVWRLRRDVCPAVCSVVCESKIPRADHVSWMSATAHHPGSLSRHEILFYAEPLRKTPQVLKQCERS